MDIAVIMALIFEMLEKCQEDEDKLRDRLKNPGVREYLGLVRLHRREEGLRGRALRKAAQEDMDTLKSLTDEEIEDIVCAACEG
jgi:hypothetical protein